MELNNTVEGTFNLILEAEPLSEAGRKFLESLECPVNIEIRTSQPAQETCPVCGSTYLIKEGKCTTCYECGWSKCNL